MSRDTFNLKARLVIEKYRDGRLVEVRRTENIVLWYLAYRIVNLVYFHDQGAWDSANQLNQLALGDMDKIAIKTIPGGLLNASDDSTAQKWVVQISWSDDSTDSYTVYTVALLDAGTDLPPGNTITPFAYHYAVLDTPITKGSADTINYIWTIEIPYGAP